MLCSYSTGKTGSRWLDRLRTAKGFPENGASDLENFLQNPDSSNTEAPKPTPNPVPVFDHGKNEDKQLFNMMSNVLCELFNFGDTSTCSTKLKKSARKQANPRICAFSNNGNDDTNNVDSEKVASRSGDSNSGVEAVKESNERKNEGEGEGDADADADGDGDGRELTLPGFSRTEVTVIDTSYESWKFEKLLYRKKNVWTVRDKKGKSENVGSKKKRKAIGIAEEDQSRGKKPKELYKEGRGEECELPLNEVHHQSDKSEEVHERTLKQRQTELPSKKLEKGSSSVILIKSIPTSKKNGTNISKHCLKSK